MRNFVFLRRKMHLVNYRVRGTTYIVDYERWRESHAEDERGKSRSVTAAPAIIPKKRCSVYRFTATLDYLVSAPLAALLARLVAILRRRSKSAPHAVVSLVSRLVSHTPAVRSS